MKKFLMKLLGIPEVQLPKEGPFTMWYGDDAIVALGKGEFPYLVARKFKRDVYYIASERFEQLEGAQAFLKRTLEEDDLMRYKSCLAFIRWYQEQNK